MKTFILATLAAISVSASAQTYSGSFAFDSKAHAVPVVGVTLNTYHDVLDRRGWDLDLQVLTEVRSNARFGFALTHPIHLTVPLSRELRPVLDLQVGPWVNYATDARKVTGGLFVSIGAKF
jgi:hypothetical protein